MGRGSFYFILTVLSVRSSSFYVICRVRDERCRYIERAKKKIKCMTMTAHVGLPQWWLLYNMMPKDTIISTKKKKERKKQF